VEALMAGCDLFTVLCPSSHTLNRGWFLSIMSSRFWIKGFGRRIIRIFFRYEMIFFFFE
jgi:hypothetical protein